MGTKTTREFKIGWIRKAANACKDAGRELDEEKLLALFAIECLSTRRTGREILDDLKLSGQI